MAANGESGEDGRDRSSNYYAETIVIPTRQAAAKAPTKKTTAKKASAKTTTAKKTTKKKTEEAAE